MPKYIKKPVEIEAVQYKKDAITEDLMNFILHSDRNIKVNDDSITIHTLEGNMKVSDGDFIIKGIRGEYYPCKPDIFKETYTEISK